MPVLVRLADDGSPRVQDVLSLPGEDNLIGRGVGVHVSLVDETVSRMHARVFFDSGRWVLATLSAANPARVRGAAITSVALEPGTVFELGRIRLRFEMEDPRRRPTMQLDAQPERREPPGPTPTFDMVLTPELPERVEPEAARGSWQAAPPLSIPAPDAARARVEAMGLEALPPPLDHRRGGVRVMEPPSYSTEGPVVQGRRWPWVLLGMALSMGFMGIVLKERIAETIARHTDSPEVAVAPAKQGVASEGDSAAKSAAPTQAAPAPSAPTPTAMQGSANDEARKGAGAADNCSTRSQAQLDEITGLALAQELERRGPPNHLRVMREANGELQWELRYAKSAKRVTFTAQSSGKTEALEPNAKPAASLISPHEWGVAVAGLSEPACLAGQFGMLPARAPGPQAALWQSSRASLATQGGELRSFELRGLPASSAIGTDIKQAAPANSAAPSSATGE